LVQEKFKFLYELYQELIQIKNQFQEQLIVRAIALGIYHITRQLDTLEEEEVLIKALGVLEDVMTTISPSIRSTLPTVSPAWIYSSLLRGQITSRLTWRITTS
jgi:hypothetical protein